MIHKVKELKSEEDIAKEWNKIAQSRLSELLNGSDLSFDKILIPSILKEIPSQIEINAIDIGCGVGYATNEFHKLTNTILGIDISSKSIELAKRQFGISKKINFINSSIEEFASENQSKYNLGIANMALMDMPNIAKSLEAISKILQDNALFIITITHPYFWPFYWEYAKKPWFNYDEEIQIEATFKISNNKSEFVTTHVHRPLQIYINALLNNNFSLMKLEEPMPSNSVENEYPKKWQFPRFLKLICEKKSSSFCAKERNADYGISTKNY